MLYGGKKENGKIIFRENSETFPERDGFMEHKYKEVITFYLLEEEMNLEWTRFTSGKQNTFMGQEIKENDRFSFDFSKEKPSHLRITISPDGEYDNLDRCIRKGYREREKFWGKFLDFDYEGDAPELTKEEWAIVAEFGLMEQGESQLTDTGRKYIRKYH